MVQDTLQTHLGIDTHNSNMNGFSRNNLPAGHNLQCTLCHEQQGIEAVHYREAQVQTDTDVVKAEVYEIECQNCSGNVAMAAFLSHDATNAEDYSGWGSSGRPFLGFVSQGRSDARGGGKFISMNGERVPTVQLV